MSSGVVGRSQWHAGAFMRVMSISGWSERTHLTFERTTLTFERTLLTGYKSQTCPEREYRLLKIYVSANGSDIYAKASNIYANDSDI